MLLAISYTERGAAAKHSQARTRSNQQETGQQNLLFDEINVVLVSIGLLMTFVSSLLPFCNGSNIVKDIDQMGILSLLPNRGSVWQ